MQNISYIFGRAQDRPYTLSPFMPFVPLNCPFCVFVPFVAKLASILTEYPYLAMRKITSLLTCVPAFKSVTLTSNA